MAFRVSLLRRLGRRYSQGGGFEPAALGWSVSKHVPSVGSESEGHLTRAHDRIRSLSTRFRPMKVTLPMADRIPPGLAFAAVTILIAIHPGMAFGQALDVSTPRGGSATKQMKGAPHYAEVQPLNAGAVLGAGGHVFAPLSFASPVISMTADGNGGVFVLTAESVVHHRADGSSEVLVSRDSPVMNGGKGFSGALHPWISSQRRTPVFPIVHPQLRSPKFGSVVEVGFGTAPMPLLAFDGFVSVVDAGSTKDTKYFHTHALRESGSGPVMIAFLGESSATALMDQYYLDVNGRVVKFTRQEQDRAIFYVGQMTDRYVWYGDQTATGAKRLRRKSKLTGEETVAISGFEEFGDASGFGGTVSTADSLTFFYKEKGGRWKMVNVPDGRFAVPVVSPLLNGDPDNIGGFKLADVRAYSAGQNGEYLFAMETPQGRGFFMVRDGAGSIVVEPSRSPPGVPVKGAGGKYVMLSTGSIGAPLNEVWVLLRPVLTQTAVRGQAGKVVSIDCTDCPVNPKISYGSRIADRIVPAASNGRAIEFTIPFGLAGAHEGVVSVSGLELSFKIDVTTPAPIEPTVTGLAGLDQIAVAKIAQLQVLQLFGSHLCGQKTVSTSTANQADGIPLPTRLAGCQIRIRNRDQRQWWQAPLYFAWTSSSTPGPSQMNFLVPGELAEGPAELIVDRLSSGADSNQVEASSAPFGIEIVDAAPTVFRDDRSYPLIYNASRGSYVSGENPVYAGDILSVIFTGGGRTRPQAPTGHASTGEIVAPVEVKLGDIASEILYAGAQGTPGLYQVNFRAPFLRNIGTPLVQLKITIGTSSQTVSVNYSE